MRFAISFLMKRILICQAHLPVSSFYILFCNFKKLATSVAFHTKKPHFNYLPTRLLSEYRTNHAIPQRNQNQRELVYQA